MTYREIAKDMMPDERGIYRGDKVRRTAPKNWYVNYLQGGGLKQTIALSTDRLSKDPKLSNPKGKL